MGDFKTPKNIFDEQYRNIVYRTPSETGKVFTDEEKKIILSDKNLNRIFAIAGIFHKTPRDILSGLDLDIWDVRIKQGAINNKQANIIAYETAGGNCPRCGEPWKYVEGEYIGYYQPHCTCFPRCHICNRWLAFEAAGKIDHCQHCGYLACTKIVEKKADDNRKYTYKAPCGGKLLLIGAVRGASTYQCEKCNASLSWQIII